MATKTFKIGLSNTEKQNMAQDVYERLIAMCFDEYDSTKTYNEGDFVVYENPSDTFKLYKCIAETTTGTWDSDDWELATFQDLVDDVEGAVASVNGKANTIDLVNGTLVVAKALSAKSIENISEDSGSTQDDPFIAQGTGTNNNTSEVSTSPVAKQLEKQGNTVVVNQQVRNPTFNNTTYWSWGAGISAFSVSNNVATITSNGEMAYPQISTSANIINGHKYLLIAEMKCDSTSNITQFAVGWSTTFVIVSSSTSWTKLAGVIVASETRNSIICYAKQATAQANENFYMRNCYCYDLGQWDLSDSVITRLTSHPEEWLNYDCTDDSYNEGTIKNANGVTLVTIKKNIWDEERKANTYLVNGVETPVSGYFTTENYIRVLPNKDYVLSGIAGDGKIAFYDKDNNFISEIGINTLSIPLTGTRLFTIPSNCVWIKFYNPSTTGNVSLYLVYWKDNDDHSQGMDGDHYNTYLPYEKHEYNTGSETLRSAGSVKDYKEPNGTIHRLVGTYTFTGNETLTSVSSQRFYYSGLSSLVKRIGDYTKANMTAEGFNVATKQVVESAKYQIAVSYEGLIYFYFESTTTLEQAKAYLAGKTIHYELAIETTEQGTSFPENIEVDDYGMMYWLDGDGNFVETPQGCKFFYPADYVLLIDDLNNYTNGDVTSLAKKSDVPIAPNTYLTSLAGYDATKTQTLKNVNGVFTWVDDE